MAILEAVLPDVATVIYKDLSGIDRLVYAKPQSNMNIKLSNPKEGAKDCSFFWIK